MMRVTLSDGTVVTAGPALTQAGEGSIHPVVERPDLVLKIFHSNLTGRAEKLQKVAAMTACRPAGAVQPDGFVVLTWPLDVVCDGGATVGYVMPRIDTATAVEIHTMSNPADRLNPLPSAPQWTKSATWGHLVNVAANLCLAVQTVHRVDAVIGDFQERNILVANTTRVTLVDCDSMQFCAPDEQVFPCAVGRPEFTAPELRGIDLRTQHREQPSDLFALAVHIYLLLMGGNHPFMRGRWSGDGEQPDAGTLAVSGEWVGAPGSRLGPHPLAPPVDFLPADIQELFGRALTGGAQDPAVRPTAAEWRAALQRIQVRMCPRSAHQIPLGTTACPWCAIDDERVRRRTARTGQSAVAATGPQPLTGPQALTVPSAPKGRTLTTPVESLPTSAGRRKFSRGERILIAVTAAFLVIIAAGVLFLSSPAVRTAVTPVGEPASILPPGAVACSGPDNAGDRFVHAAAAGASTSCAFAEQVRARASETSAPLPIEVAIDRAVPDSGIVQCAATGSLARCASADGTAVVYLY
jgi:eukaryotic-like serine/threonine-protein kinase